MQFFFKKEKEAAAQACIYVHGLMMKRGALTLLPGILARMNVQNLKVLTAEVSKKKGEEEKMRQR